MKRYFALILFFVLLTCSSTGYTYTEKAVTFSLKTGKKSVSYVSFYASEALELKPVTAHNKIGYTQNLEDMAKANQAIAAINGTYFNPYDHKDLQPMGTILINNELVHARGGSVAMGIMKDNKLSFSSTRDIKITGGINGSWEWPNNWYAWFINHLPTSQDEIVIFTPRFRSSSLLLPGFTFIVTDRGLVTQIVKDKANIPATGFVVAYGSRTKDAAKFHLGDKVQYWTTLPQTLNSAVHLIGVGPKLVTLGKPAVDLTGFTEDKITKSSGQRSFIGHTSNHVIIFGTANNVTIHELAELCTKLGLVEAMSLDGGASSGLYYNGKYITKPGRPLSNALILRHKSK